jgi:asparagine synthase (glutamine-hydrolysing)
MFRAPLNSFFLDGQLPYTDQLLSEESIRKTGYFDYEAIKKWRQSYPKTPQIFHKRDAVEMGLVGALATQLWHHTYIDPTLADLPDWKSYCPDLDADEDALVAEPELVQRAAVQGQSSELS